MTDPTGFHRPIQQSALVQLIGVPLGLALGLFIFFHWNSPFGLVIAVFAPIAAVINISLIARSRSRLVDRPPVTAGTGQILRPVSTSWTTPGHRDRWIGAADMLGGLGRVNVSWPLAVLEIVDDSLTLRIRPRLLARLFGVTPIEVARSDAVEVFPARARLGFKAIGIRARSGPPAYFLTVGQDRASILSVISQLGFLIDWEERKFSYG